jgi:hypothetical protein
VRGRAKAGSGDTWVACGRSSRPERLDGKIDRHAALHPLGVGDARYRLGGSPQAVDTAPFGAFRRSLVERVGYFDETLLTNEDYEF